MQLKKRGLIVLCILFFTFAALALWSTQSGVTTATNDVTWRFQPILDLPLEAPKTEVETNETEPVFEKKVPVRAPYVKLFVADLNAETRQKIKTSKTSKPRITVPYDFKPQARTYEGSKDVPNVEFHLHFFRDLKTAYSTVCSPCKEEFCEHCELFAKYHYHLNRTQTKETEAKLHIIPLDPLAWMKSTNEEQERAERLSQRLIQGFHLAEPYLRFKGSDHVFLCLTSVCSEFAVDFVEHLSSSQGTRAIFAGVNATSKSSQWPCPLRILNLQNSTLPDVESTVLSIIKESSYMIYEGNRWVCADNLHPENHWYTKVPGKKVGGNVMKEHGFVLCSIPKCGSTMIKMLLRRMMHRKNWRQIGDGLIHSPYRNGLISVNNKKDPKLAKLVFEDPNSIKAAIVRNPAARLLSGYLDKIVRKQQYSRIPGLGKVAKRKGRIPTFAETVDVLIRQHPNPDKLDHHFRAQSSFCGFRHFEFDFLGELENLGDDFIIFAKSMKFWTKYGADGWGKNQTDPFVHASAYRYQAHHSENQIWEYYTEDLLMKVYKYYKEDFRRLGYSIHELLDSRPANQTLHELK